MIQNTFGLSAEEAEAAKKTVAWQIIMKMMCSLLSGKAWQQNNAGFTIFLTSTQYNEVNFIVLAGGCAALSGLDDAVQLVHK